MIRNFRLTIEYDGTLFHGWQIQPKKMRTVQGEFDKTFRKIFNKHIILIGAGRTDTGVHALGQTANFKVDTKLPSTKILKALNANLPEDISIRNIEEVPKNFHAQFDAKTKTYRYIICPQQTRSAVMRHFCFFYPYAFDLRLIRQEAKELLGRKDFSSFQAHDPMFKRRGKDRTSSIRTIKRLTIKQKDDFIYIDIEADGFLYKMVRNIVGTLLGLGNKHLTKGSMKNILSKKNRRAAGITAPAKGLFLLEVKY